MTERLKTMDEKGQRLKELRRTLNLSQKEIAAILNMSGASGVSNIETGYASLTENNIQLLKERLYVNPEWLQTGEGSMFLTFDNKRKLLTILNKIDDDNDPVLAALIYLLESNRLSDFIKMIQGGSR